MGRFSHSSDGSLPAGMAPCLPPQLPAGSLAGVLALALGLSLGPLLPAPAPCLEPRRSAQHWLLSRLSGVLTVSPWSLCLYLPTGSLQLSLRRIGGASSRHWVAPLPIAAPASHNTCHPMGLLALPSSRFLCVYKGGYIPSHLCRASPPPGGPPSFFFAPFFLLAGSLWGPGTLSWSGRGEFFPGTGDLYGGHLCSPKGTPAYIWKRGPLDRPGWAIQYLMPILKKLKI